MQSYSIYIRFRGANISATVHHYETFYIVYFSDNTIIQDFGGQLEFDQLKNPLPKANQQVKDFPDLCRAVKSELQ